MASVLAAARPGRPLRDLHCRGECLCGVSVSGRDSPLITVRPGTPRARPGRASPSASEALSNTMASRPGPQGAPATEDRQRCGSPSTIRRPLPYQGVGFAVLEAAFGLRAGGMQDLALGLPCIYPCCHGCIRARLGASPNGVLPGLRWCFAHACAKNAPFTPGLVWSAMSVGGRS